jgi:hypothetical protein
MCPASRILTAQYPSGATAVKGVINFGLFALTRPLAWPSAQTPMYDVLLRPGETARGWLRAGLRRGASRAAQTLAHMTGARRIVLAEHAMPVCRARGGDYDVLAYFHRRRQPNRPERPPDTQLALRRCPLRWRIPGPRRATCPTSAASGETGAQECRPARRIQPNDPEGRSVRGLKGDSVGGRGHHRI